MTFESFEQERHEATRRAEQARQEKLQAAHAAAAAVKAELADLAAAFVQNAKVPPRSELIQRHITYSPGTVRRGWNPFAKGIIEHAQINLRAHGWYLGKTESVSFEDGIYPHGWYIDTSGGLWFDIRPSLRVVDVTYNRSNATGKTPQAQALLDSLNNRQFTGDSLPRTPSYTKDYKGKLQRAGDSVPPPQAQLPLDRLANELSITHFYVYGESEHIFDHLFTLPKEFSLDIRGLPVDLRWGPWLGSGSDGLHFDRGEYRPTPLIKRVYECAVERGIIG